MLTAAFLRDLIANRDDKQYCCLLTAPLLPSAAAQLRDAVLFCVAPIAGIAWYCADFKEKEKLHHRCAGARGRRLLLPPLLSACCCC